ncbi:MAG: helix-turn-helix domain-containing protein [Cetobacterium sp.]
MTTENRVMHIRGLCKYFRKEVLKLTVKEVAMKTNIPQQNIYAFERGSTTRLIYFLSYYMLISEMGFDDKFLFFLENILNKK